MAAIIKNAPVPPNVFDILEFEKINTTPWQNLDLMSTSNNAYAHCNVGNGAASKLIWFRDWGFNVPADSKIDGITVVVERSKAFFTPPTGVEVRDTHLHIVRGGVIQAENKAKTTLNWPSVDGLTSYGGITNLWGTTWLWEEINSPNFGLVFSCQAISTEDDPSFAARARIDLVRMTVNYTTVVSRDKRDDELQPFGWKQIGDLRGKRLLGVDWWIPRNRR